MSFQTTIYDAIAESEARDLGLELAAAHGQPLTKLAQIIAARLARKKGVVTIEDVRKELDRRVPGWEPGNWMGSVFAGRRWQWTGRMVKTRHKNGHGRAVREWRLRGRHEP